MPNLTGKTAIVTGASKGIGAAVAKHLAAAGANVVVNYASSKQGADDVVKAITTAGGKAIAVQGDVAKEADVKALFAAAQKAYGKLDVLVNNAGVFAFAPLEDVTESEFHRQFNINVLGTLLASREAAKQFGKSGGSIINLSSVVSQDPFPGSVVYSSTKGAVDTLTITLARELGPRNIRVNAVAPGGTETEGLHSVGVMGSEAETNMVAATPLGRLGQPDDIAKVVAFLASEEAGWITGQHINVSGGK